MENMSHDICLLRDEYLYLIYDFRTEKHIAHGYALKWISVLFFQQISGYLIQLDFFVPRNGRKIGGHFDNPSEMDVMSLAIPVMFDYNQGF